MPYKTLNITNELLWKAQIDFEWTYYSDLYYFSAFNYLKEEKVNRENLIGDYEFFIQYLKEYNVKRTIEADSNEAAWETFKSIAKKDLNPQWIDQLADKEFRLLHPLKKLNTSVSSKLGMLHFPQKIIPLDRFNKDAINYREREYQGFMKHIEEFKKDKASDIENLMISIKERAIKIETIFDKQLDQIELIRYNRALDKLLLQIGREKEGVRSHKRLSEPQPY